MKIGIDGRILDWKYSGIARYVQLLLSFDIFKNATVYFPQKTTISLPETFKKKVLKNPFKRRELYEQIILPFHLSKDKIDLFIQPYNFGIPLLYSGKSILLVFDIIPLLYKDYFYFARFKPWAKWNYQENSRIALNKATRVICDSESAREDIIKYFTKIDKSKIDYIYYGFSNFKINGTIDFEKFKKEKGIKSKYILDNAGLEDRKNAQVLVEAFAKSSNSLKNKFQIVITGYDKHCFDKLSRLAANLKIKEKIVFVDSVSEDEKNLLIKNSDLIVNPSRFEGFGIPLLEAMVFQKPIIVSDIPAFIEVGGEYPTYFKDNDAADLLEKMQTFLNYPENEKQKCERLGKRQLEKFTISKMKFKWEKLINELTPFTI